MHFTEQPDFRVHFLGIGAPKGGTTWLSAVLGAHPDIFTPPGKEIEYFNHRRADYDIENRNFHQPLSWYHRHFRAAREGQVIGEVNPMYMLPVTRAADLQRYHPGLKLIAILRDPVDRARSQYQFNSKWLTGVPDQFEGALEKYPDLIRDSEYGKLLSPFFSLFPREQILVIFHEDLKRDAQGVYNQATRFLGVRDFTPPNLHDRPNETRTVRNAALGGVLAKTREWMFRLGLENLRPALRKVGALKLVEWLREDVNTGAPPPSAPVSPELDARLRAHFAPDVAVLESLVNRDLSHWKRPRTPSPVIANLGRSA